MRFEILFKFFVIFAALEDVFAHFDIIMFRRNRHHFIEKKFLPDVLLLGYHRRLDLLLHEIDQGIDVFRISPVDRQQLLTKSLCISGFVEPLSKRFGPRNKAPKTAAPRKPPISIRSCAVVPQIRR